MLYIVVALKPEAQAFVDKYKLTKSKLHTFTIFSNDKMMLIVSGVGVKNARIATQTLINNFDITDEDKYLNMGICGASSSYEIGEILEIGCVVYEGISYMYDEGKKEIFCSDEAVSETGYEIVDMDSFGFYDAVIHNPAIKQFSIIKVVSDHFEPNKVTKEATKMLIFHTIKDLF